MENAKSLTYKCPSCGAYLEFEPSSGKFLCPYCNESFDESTVKAAVSSSSESSEGSDSAYGFSEYHCQNCGAAVILGETTAATRCYFCHSPVIIANRLSREFRPDGVIPFKIAKEQAVESFLKFIGKKKFVDKSFFSAEQQQSITGVYYPFWEGNLEGEASFTGVGTRVSSIRSGNYLYTTTKYFNVRRKGTVKITGMIRKALKSNEKKLTDGIQPFNFEDMRPFDPSCLSGFSAEMRDVEREDAMQSMISSANSKADSLMRQGLSFASLNGSTAYRNTKAALRYVLLPAWIITYPGKNPEEPFYYMMNGQTGKVKGRLPIDWKKMLLWCLALFALVFCLLLAGGAFIW